jgi:hypothetical protein
VNQVMQRAILHENWARDNKSHGRFRENNKDKDRGGVGMIEKDAPSDDEAKVCIAE